MCNYIALSTPRKKEQTQDADRSMHVILYSTIITELYNYIQYYMIDI